MDDSSNVERLGDDLDYVRSVVERAEQRTTVPSIHVMWAVVSLAGFTIIDFRPQWAGLYWLIAGPLGGLAGLVLGARWSRRVGQVSRRAGRLHAIHWFGFLGTLLLLTPMMVRGELRGDAIARVILLMIGLAYLLAGNYLAPRLRWVALAVFAGYGLTFVVPAYPWTVTGVILAASLVVAGLLGPADARTRA